MEILTAYVREHAPWKEEEQISQEETLPSETQPTQNHQSLPKLAADIQAILTVVGRRTWTYGQGEDQRLNLSATDLRGADLWAAHLEGAHLWDVHLEGAVLVDAHLEGADLENAHLEEAHLGDAHLEEAELGRTHLEGADLRAINLEEADRWATHLEGADLRGAHLEGAHLWATHLEGARNLTVDQLCTVYILYQVRLDPPLAEQIRQQCPKLLEKPQE